MKTNKDILLELHGWAIQQWEIEVKDRPMQNVFRQMLNNTWKQVIQKIIDMKAENAEYRLEV